MQELFSFSLLFGNGLDWKAKNNEEILTEINENGKTSLRFSFSSLPVIVQFKQL